MLSVTKDCKPLDQTLCMYDADNKVFSSSEDFLVVLSILTMIVLSILALVVLSTLILIVLSILALSCTFNTDSDCTFDTGSDCTFNTDSDCVIVRRDIFEVIQPEEGTTIKKPKRKL